MTVAWNFPNRIIFGVGAVEHAGVEAHRLNAKNALIVTDKNVSDAGLVDGVTRSLQLSDVAWVTFDQASHAPDEALASAIAEAARDAHADLLVAVGGGAVVDAAKAANLRAAIGDDTPLDEFEAGRHSQVSVQTQRPLIAVPTTAGSGSEVSKWIALVVEANGERRKTTVEHDCLLPTVALLDPQLSISQPQAVTKATGFSALTRSIEAYCAGQDHPMAEAIALESIELLVKNLERVLEHSSDLEARSATLKAASMAAVAAQKGVGACHAIAHSLSIATSSHEGLAHAVCLPQVLDYNRGTIPYKIAKIARMFGVRGNDIETLAFECAGAVRAFRTLLGLSEHLAGSSGLDLETVADHAVHDPAHHGNPRPCTREDLLALLRASV